MSSRDVTVDLALSGQITYRDIVIVKVDRDGALRLYRLGGLVARQVVYHPPGEWRAVTVRPSG